MKKILIASLVVIISFAATQPSTVLGCAIGPGDRWFSVASEVTSNPLSDVLDVSISSNGSLVTFTNKGLTSTLYIASEDTDGIYPGYDESRRDYRPAADIIGQDYDPHVRILVRDGLPQGFEVFRGGWSKASIDPSDEHRGTVSLDAVLDTTDNYTTRQVFGDHRPENVEIPEPDHQTMYAFYQGQRYDIDILLTYSLNSDYDPVKSTAFCNDGPLRPSSQDDAEDNSGTNWLALAIVPAAAIAVLVTIFLYQQQKSRKKQTKSSLRKPKNRKM